MSVRIAVVLLSLTAGFELRADNAEERAIAFVKKFGGEVTQDKKQNGNPVVAVNLHDQALTAADVTVLQALPQLKQLELIGTKLSDETWKAICGFKSLTELKLNNVSISEGGNQGIGRNEDARGFGRPATPSAR